MAKKDRFPDAYSSGFPPNEESEGSGCSGRDHMETSGYENSSGPRKKWIKLSSALHDGFGVPVQSVPLSTLPSSEKHKWLLRLRSELDQVRTFQKKVDMDKAHVTMSSSSNIVTSNKVEGNQTNLKKSMDVKAQKPQAINPGVTGRFQSVKTPTQPDTFSLLLRKQCDNLLKKVMSHQHGWVFNKPVDIVALKIPDYPNVIKKPMDLGTVKQKLSSGKYLTPFQFVADVRLTFSNAMTYNPPGNDVHIMADVLSKFFELRWKPIEKKLQQVNSSQQQQPVHEVIDLVKPNPMPPSKKRKVTSIQQNLVPEPVKLVMTNEEKHNLSKELETHLGDLPDNVIDFLRKHGSNGSEDEIEIDIDDLDDVALFELRKMLDDHAQKKQNNSKVEPCVIELLNESGLSNSTMQLYKGNDVADEDVDAGGNGNEPPVSSYHPPVESDKETSQHNKQTALGISSDSNSSSASENEVKDVKASSLFSGTKDADIAGADLDHKIDIDDSVENRSDAEQQKGNCVESDRQKDDDGESEKLYRAAVLKNRFADTILKAREKTLHQADPREKEQLEHQKKKEKARLQAEAKAAEEARRRVEAEAAAEAKRKRDLQRQAARQALLKMEKTVEIDEASRFLKDLEMLRDPDQLLPSSCLDETSPEHDSQDGLGSFKFGATNPLEQLGLYMKRDDDHHEEEEEEEETPDLDLEPVVTFMNNDVEEGEIN